MFKKVVLALLALAILFVCVSAVPNLALASEAVKPKLMLFYYPST